MTVPEKAKMMRSKIIRSIILPTIILPSGLVAKGRFEACGGLSHRKNAHRVFVPFARMSFHTTLSAVFALALTAAAQPATTPLF